VIHPAAARRALAGFQRQLIVPKAATAAPARSSGERAFCALRRELEAADELVPVAVDAGLWQRLGAAGLLAGLAVTAAVAGHWLPAALLLGVHFELVGTCSHDIAHLPRGVRARTALRCVPEVVLGTATSWWGPAKGAAHAAGMGCIRVLSIEIRE
jgi:hypothetical protein